LCLTAWRDQLGSTMACGLSPLSPTIFNLAVCAGYNHFDVQAIATLTYVVNESADDLDKHCIP